MKLSVQVLHSQSYLSQTQVNGKVIMRFTKKTNKMLKIAFKSTSLQFICKLLFSYFSKERVQVNRK